MQNIQEKLVEEFERLIIQREKYRAHHRKHSVAIALDPALSDQIMINLNALNDVIVTCKEALGTSDALASLKAVSLAEQIPHE